MVEMLAVVVVIGIAAVLAAPMLRSTGDYQLRQAGRLIAADLGQAQIRSITRGDNRCAVLFDLPNNRYHLANASDLDTPIDDEINGGFYRVTLGQGRAAGLEDVALQSVNFADAATDQTALTFGLYGELNRASDATLTLASGGLSLTVTVSADTGEASVGPIQ